MAKSYSEQLGEWVKQRESTKRDRNLVAFLAVKTDVKAAINDGYAVKTIWSNMHESGRVKFGYDTFLNYVNRQLRQQKTEKAGALPNAVTVPTSSTEGAQHKTTSAKTKLPAAPAGFTFDPLPDKKDLI